MLACLPYILYPRSQCLIHSSIIIQYRSVTPQAISPPDPRSILHPVQPTLPGLHAAWITQDRHKCMTCQMQTHSCNYPACSNGKYAMSLHAWSQSTRSDRRKCSSCQTWAHATCLIGPSGHFLSVEKCVQLRTVSMLH